MRSMIGWKTTSRVSPARSTASMRRRDQGEQLLLRVDAVPAEDRGEVVAHRAGADRQAGGDRRHSLPGEQPLEDLGLRGAELLPLAGGEVESGGTAVTERAQLQGED